MARATNGHYGISFAHEQHMRMTLHAAAAAALSLGVVAAVAAQGSPRVTARTTGSIAGRVIQADGLAAEGARVAIYAIREGAPASVVGTATTAHDGRYEVDGLPAGRFAVGVTAQRIRSFGGDARRPASAPIETFYPGTTERVNAQPVTVFESTPTEGIDVWLEPAARRYSISGRVSWPDGANATNVAIEYGGPDEVHGGVWYVSDPGGLFTIEGASRGTYVLLARAETPQGPLIGIASTDVANDSVQDVRLVLGPPGTVEGRIVVDGTATIDVTTLRVAPRQMLLTPSPIHPAAEGEVDGTGRFSVPDLLGDYNLAVTGLPPGWRVRRVTKGGAQVAGDRVRVHTGEKVMALEVVVGPTR